MNKIKFLSIICSVILILASCSKPGLNTSVEIDKIKLEINKTIVNLNKAYPINPLTQELGPANDIINVLVYAIVTVSEMADIQKIKDWDVQLFDANKNECRLNQVKASILDTIEGDENLFRFQVTWYFVGDKPTDLKAFNLHLPEEKIIPLDSLVELYEFGEKVENE